ncbi:MAG: hypothetical protein GWN08_16865, partial [Gemmatimonadetes bacterium]|nr:hypothetical protein [Gemmatimonadota bacterium]NIW76894.1 hypothetical protein [Gemmatimonadota bacterium]
YCTDADQDSDVICCSSTADCLRGRCVGGYPDVDRVCVVDTPGEDASHLCHEAAGATGMALDRCYSTDGDGGVVFVSHYGDGDCDRDGVLNAFDACDCVDGMGAIDGCPPTMDGGVIPDGGANDASP